MPSGSRTRKPKDDSITIEGRKYLPAPDDDDDDDDDDGTEIAIIRGPKVGKLLKGLRFSEDDDDGNDGKKKGRGFFDRL